MTLIDYMSRKGGGRELASIEDNVDASIQRREDCILKIGGRLISDIRKNNVIMRTNRTIINRKEKWKENQLYGHFKRIISDISHKKTLMWLRKVNLKRETEFLLIAAQNNEDNNIRTSHIKARIDKTQQNSRCRLYGDRDENINHIISECSKFAQKEYQARHDRVGKVIHWELFKKFKFDHTNKLYKYNPVSVIENDTNKLLWGVDIQTDH